MQMYKVICNLTQVVPLQVRLLSDCPFTLRLRSSLLLLVADKQYCLRTHSVILLPLLPLEIPLASISLNGPINRYGTCILPQSYSQVKLDFTSILTSLYFPGSSTCCLAVYLTPQNHMSRLSPRVITCDQPLGLSQANLRPSASVCQYSPFSATHQ